MKMKSLKMKSRCMLAMFLLALGVNPAAQAISNNSWKDISDVGVGLMIGSAMVLPVIRSDWQGLREAGYSMGLAEGIAILGKTAFHEERPDHSDNNSFPSGHAAVAFAAATSMHRRYGWQTGLPAYALATLVASARVSSRKHHWYDSVAGGVIGIGSGWLFTDAFNEKVQLVPWVDSKGGGVQASIAW